MIADDSIEVGETDGHVWVRVRGKGSFATSPPLKGFVERCMDGGDQRFVIDLGECPAMDSTFMGTLAGLAMRLAKKAGGALQLNGVGERNRQSLSDLGLDALLDINPEDATWRGHVEDVRSRLEPIPRETEASDAAHVLDAHRKLCEASEENVKRFSTVLEVLEQDVDEK